MKSRRLSLLFTIALAVGGSSYAHAQTSMAKLDRATVDALQRSPASVHVIVRVDPASLKRLESAITRG